MNLSITNQEASYMLVGFSRDSNALTAWFSVLFIGLKDMISIPICITNLRDLNYLEAYRAEDRGLHELNRRK
jgi:hypothetical protein